MCPQRTRPLRLIGWSLLIVAQDHESATCQATLWWGIGEISLNHSRTILVYHWKQLFFSFLDFKTLRDVHLRTSWWTITTPAKEHLSASLMWQGWGQNVDRCLSLWFILSYRPFSSWAFILRPVIVRVTLLTWWISDTCFLPIYVHFISWCFPLLRSMSNLLGKHLCFLSIMQISGSHNRFI